MNDMIISIPTTIRGWDFRKSFPQRQRF